MLGITDHVWSENLAVDDHGNLFFAYLADGGVRLATSRDGGRTWRLLGFVSPPGIRRAIVVSVTARGRGEIALTYYGTADKGDPLGAQRDELARVDDLQPRTRSPRKPVFHSAATSPASAPTMGAEMPGCCTTDQTFLEYTGVQFTGRARSAAPSPAGPASTCPSSCSRSCAFPNPDVAGKRRDREADVAALRAQGLGCDDRSDRSGRRAARNSGRPRGRQDPPGLQPDHPGLRGRRQRGMGRASEGAPRVHRCRRTGGCPPARIPALKSGVELVIDTATLFDLRDGRIVRMQGYIDPADALEAAGLPERDA